VCLIATELMLITETLPEAQLGSIYQAQLEARGGATPYVFSLSAGSGLPEGLALRGDGRLEGTPIQAGSSQFKVQVESPNGLIASRELTLVVHPAAGQALAISTLVLPEARVNAPYDFQLEASGGDAPYSWSLASGALPAGVVLSPSGIISGTPITAGGAAFTVQVRDWGSPGQLAAANLELIVQPESGTALAVTTSSLPTAEVGLSYSAALQAAGGTTPYAWSLASGTSLPSGLVLTADGQLSGVPSQSGTSTFAVQVQDSSAPGQVATAQLSLAVGARTVSITTSSLPSGQVAQPYSATLAASGGSAPYAFSVSAGSLAPGLQLSASGALTGSPTNAGTFSFTVQVTDGSTPAQVATRSYSLVVTSGTSVTPLGITTAALPSATVGQFYAAQLSAGGGTSPYGWSVTGGALPPGLALSSSGAISGSATVAGQFGFTVTVVESATPQQSASAAFSISVTSTTSTLVITSSSLPSGTAGTPYSHALQASGGAAPYQWSVVSGALPSGLALGSDGVLSGTPSTAGVFEFTVQVADSSTPQQLAQANFTLSIQPAPGQLAITTAALPAATVGVPYSQTFAASGGTPPYAWALASGSLPNGLALSSTGILSGTPTIAGSYSFVVRVQDSAVVAQSASRAYSLNVLANPGSSFSIVTSALPNGTVGLQYNAFIAAAGGTAPYSFALASGVLPAGLTLATDGRLSGTPTISGSFSFVVRATDSSAPALTAERSFTLTVNPAAGQLTITTQALPPGRVGTSYSATLIAVSGTAPYQWILAAGALPAGLSLSAEGTISGTPTAPSNNTFTVQVTDSSTPAKSASRQLELRVLP
jgi:hypothetical protein